MARTPWDHRSQIEQQRIQSILLRQTLLQMGLGHIPFVQKRLADAGVDPRLFKGIEDLARIPPALRAHVTDAGRNPAGPAALFLKPTEEGVKRFGDRGVLWRVARARMVGGPQAQQIAIEAATRSIHVHLVEGADGTLAVPYTRDDLDILARAGARLAQLVGVEREDRLLNLVPARPSLDFWGIFYLAHGLGMSALHARHGARDLSQAAAAFAGAAPTAVALPAGEAAQFPAAAADAGLDLSSVRTIVAVGRSLTTEERAALAEGLGEAAQRIRVAAAYGPAEGRVLWGECAVPAERTETFGFHTYPDLDVVEVLAPDTARPVSVESPGEIVVTPLGFRGGGAPRWRSGDLALGGLTTRACPNCGRTVPRVGPAVRRAAWSRAVELNGAKVHLDLRDVGDAALSRTRDYQAEIVGGGTADLFVYVVPRGDDLRSLVELHEELGRRRAAPTQIVLASAEELAARHQRAGGPWPRFWERSGIPGE